MNIIDLDNKNKIPKNKNKMAIIGESAEQEQFRLVLNKEANAFLEEFVSKVNKDFRGGKAAKSEVANYIFANLKSLVSESDIKAIQSNCFDEREALLSLGKSEQNIPESVKKAVREAYGLSEKDKKRTAKVQQELSTEKSVDNSAVS